MASDRYGSIVPGDDQNDPTFIEKRFDSGEFRNGKGTQTHFPIEGGRDVKVISRLSVSRDRAVHPTRPVS
jgi:hypothetical protein